MATSGRCSITTIHSIRPSSHTAFIRELKVRLGHDTPDGLPVMKPLTTGKSAGKSKQQPSASSSKQQQQQQQTKPSKANPPTSGASSSKPTPTAPEASGGGGGGSKKKTKYVNLYGQDGELADVVLLKGRHHCDCQAGKHRLVNNCLHCGRIVCEQEGSGP